MVIDLLSRIGETCEVEFLELVWEDVAGRPGRTITVEDLTRREGYPLGLGLVIAERLVGRGLLVSAGGRTDAGTTIAITSRGVDALTRFQGAS